MDPPILLKVLNTISGNYQLSVVTAEDKVRRVVEFQSDFYRPR